MDVAGSLQPCLSRSSVSNAKLSIMAHSRTAGFQLHGPAVAPLFTGTTHVPNYLACTVNNTIELRTDQGSAVILALRKKSYM